MSVIKDSFNDGKKSSFSIALLAVIIIGLGIFLRFHQLGEESLWVDEAFTFHYVNLGWGELIDILKTDVHPILFYALGHWWADLAGNSEAALRFLPALFGSLSVVLLFFLTHKLYDAKTALLSALFMSFSHTFILYSQEAKMYAQLIFFLLLTSLLFLRFVEKPSTTRFLLLGVSNALLLHTHFFSFGIVAAEILLYCFSVRLYRVQGIDIWHRLFGIHTHHDAPLFLQSIGLALLLYLPWLPVLISQLNYRGGYLPFKFVEKFGFDGFWPIAVTVGVLGVIVISALFVSLKNRKIVRMAEHFTQRITTKHWTLAIIFLAWICGNILFHTHFFGNLFYIRYLLVLFPFIYIFFARRLRTIPSRCLLFVLLIAYLIGTGLILHSYYTLDGKEQFREAARYITEDAGMHDAVLLHTAGHVWWAFDYYYNENTPQVRLHTKEDWGAVPGQLRNTTHAYLLLSHNFQTKGYFKEKMDKQYGEPIETKKFIGITIYKYVVS